MASAKVLIVYMLLPALFSCGSANLRGTSADGGENLSSVSESDGQDALFDETGLELVPFHGADGQMALHDMFLDETMFRRLAALQCVETKKANQCLMARASRAEREWSSSWTEYAHNDDQLSSNNLRTDCSGFVSWAIRGCQTDNLGERVLEEITPGGLANRKRARNYYYAFGPSGSGKWCRVEDYRNVDAGDVLVYDIWAQPDDEPGDSGHIMIAYRSPFERGVTSDGKLVFAQKVIDSTSKAHFDYFTFIETRSNCPLTTDCGAGVGYVYVWTDSRGSVLAIRLRGNGDRNELDCTATKDGRNVAVPCFPQSNSERHHYRIGRLRN